MLRIFMPLYLCIFMFVSFQEEAGDIIVDVVAPTSRLTDYIKNLTSAFVFLDETLPAKPQSEWTDFLNRLSENSNVHYALTPLNVLSAPNRNRQDLMNGNIWVNDNKIYKGIKSSDYVVTITVDESVNEYEAARMKVDFGLYLLFSGAILVWALWLQVRVNQLAKVTRNIGEGNFEDKVPLGSTHVIGDLNHSISKMSGQIKSFLSFQKNVINTISHELRTPLTRVKFELEYIEDVIDDNQLTLSVNSINEDLDELDSLISELLDYAKAENRKQPLDIEQHSLRQYLNRWRTGYKCDTTNLTVDVINSEHDISCYFDEKLLTRVMNNLTNNALRYAKSKIVIQFHVTAEGVLIDVEDDGPGIPAQLQQDIFTPFTQSENVAIRGAEGFGLGLAIAEQIMKLHQGSIRVSDSDLGGAKFSLSLPLGLQGREPGHTG